RSSSVIDVAWEAARAFFAGITRDAGAGEERVTLERDFWTGDRQAAWHSLDDALDGVRALAESLRGGLDGSLTALGKGPRPDRGALEDALEVGARRANEIRRDLATIVDGAAGRVTWLDAGRAVSLGSSPVDLSTLLRSRLFEVIPSAVLTSATLA